MVLRRGIAPLRGEAEEHMGAQGVDGDRVVALLVEHRHGIQRLGVALVGTLCQGLHLRVALRALSVGGVILRQGTNACAYQQKKWKNSHHGIKV